MKAGANFKRMQQSGIIGYHALLPALHSVHRQINAALTEMDRTASADTADIESVNNARLRVAQANLARRRLVDEICSHLISLLSAEEGERVRRLRRRDQSCFQEVSTLIRRWSPEEVSSDWAGYCAASRAIQTEILMVVSMEKELLYSFLERARSARARPLARS